MKFAPFSKKQLMVLTWWCHNSPTEKYDAVICDGAVRSGKTLCMAISFIAWAFYSFKGQSFAMCGKTIASLKRNVLSPLRGILEELGFSCREKISKNLMEISFKGRNNTFYFFGGRDESSSALIQGMTLAGVLFDEVALMPRSFVEQAVARCSVDGSRFWFNCNPEYPQHWFYQEWICQREEKNAFYLHFSMEDNPSLSKKMIKRYQSLYTGAFYQRFIEGKWVAAAGLVYPQAAEEARKTYAPSKYDRYIISCDYGTVNPSSFGLWGEAEGCWYRIEEYYYDSRREGYQRTDEEHYEALRRLAAGRRVERVIVDPSAASFMAVIRKHGEFTAFPAKNDVLDGIRLVSDALRTGRIRICHGCTDSIREFGLYRWESSGRKDMPRKEFDHAMDDIRYFVSTALAEQEECFAVAAPRRGKQGRTDSLWGW